ncbi:MAG TPA: AraC family transcriptional regulator [Phycisphaerae bacterium]|nr:AraC family transcriptional regulator [Phycisphaerae bacterium]
MTVAREFKFKPHKHKGFFEIDYVFEGVLTEEINNRKYVFPAGTLVFIREKDTHSLYGSDLKLLNIVFSRKLMDTSISAAKLFNGIDVPYVTIPQKNRETFEAALNELFLKQGTPECELLSNRFFYDVLLEWFLPGRYDRIPAAPEWLRRGIEEMEKADVAKWLVKDVVRKCCKSREHTARTFQAVFGCSISGYINRRRLEKAKKQLIYTNMSISDICFDTGFNNVNYFYRLFKRFFFITPADYRRKNTHKSWAIITGKSTELY